MFTKRYRVSAEGYVTEAYNETDFVKLQPSFEAQVEFHILSLEEREAAQPETISTFHNG